MEIIDIVAPNGNELSLINRAEKLGWDGVCLLYHEKEISEGRINEINAKYSAPDNSFRVSFGVITKSNPSKFNKYGVLFSRSNNVNLIKQNVNVLFDIEELSDSMHQRKSGLNHVICNLMSDKGVCYGISISSILKSNQRANLLGSIIQNIMLCNKYKVKIVCGSFASSPLDMHSPGDIESFLRILGVKDTKGCFSPYRFK